MMMIMMIEDGRKENIQCCTREGVFSRYDDSNCNQRFLLSLQYCFCNDDDDDDDDRQLRESWSVWMCRE
jgi:hypothetical protein